MNELDKLKHLLIHWAEHNDSHVDNYNEWAQKAESLGKKELSAILRQIAQETKKQEELFKKALESI